MATRVNGTAESWVGMKVTPYFYYALTETNTEYKLVLYGGVNFKGGYSDVLEVSLQITGTGKTTIYKCLGLEPVAGDEQFINSFSWNWTKTKATQTITIKAIHGTWTDYDNPKPIGRPAYAASKTFTIPTKPTYLIKYDANGGTGAPAQQTKWYGENIKLQAGKPTRANYTFLGWATSQSGSVAYQPSVPYTANAPVTLYAVWKPFEYKITYNANGGAGAPAQQTKYYGADLTLSAVIPIRAGYTFLGWATSQGGAVAYQPSVPYTANAPVTLYAVWEAYYTYTLNTTRVNASGDIIEDPNGEWIYIKANLTTEDYTNNPLTAYHFKDNGATATVDWYKNSDKTDSVTFPYQPASNNFILYAWYQADTEKHEVSFQFDTSHTTGKVISVIVPPIFRTMDFLAGGKGVAIGKRATQEGFDVEMNTVFRNEIKCSEINGNIKNIYDVFYPVGSYFETSLTSAIPSGQSTPTSTDLDNLGVTWFDPNYAWGGTWVKVAGGLIKGEPLITRTQERKTTDTTVSSSSGINLLTVQHTSNTGKIWVYGAATVKTNTNTSAINIDANGQMAIGQQITNLKTYTRLTVMTQRSGMPIGTPFTVALRMTAQDTSTTATCAAYTTNQLFVSDVPLKMGYCWHRTA
jgi:uncharacterized repeat protein (TIGR02543 family)